MESTAPKDPFSRELIEKEIAHLKKKGSSRNNREAQRYTSRSLLTLAILAVLWFYAMDPFLHAYYRGNAVHAYLYLHNYGDDKKAAALADTRIFTTYEIKQLDERQGSFQDYFRNVEAANESSEDIIRYMNGVHDLHEGNYAKLTPFNKVRYELFVKTGLTPPMRWDFLDPSIGH